MINNPVLIIFWQGKAFIPTNAIYENGRRILIEPVQVMVPDQDELVQAVEKGLNIEPELLPALSQEEAKYLSRCLLQKFGAHSWKGLNRIGSNYSIVNSEKGLILEKSRLSKKGRWKNDPDRVKIFSPDVSLAVLIQVLLDDLNLRFPIQKDGSLKHISLIFLEAVQKELAFLVSDFGFNGPCVNFKENEDLDVYQVWFNGKNIAIEFSLDFKDQMFDCYIIRLVNGRREDGWVVNKKGERIRYHLSSWLLYRETQNKQFYSIKHGLRFDERIPAIIHRDALILQCYGQGILEDNPDVFNNINFNSPVEKNYEYGRFYGVPIKVDPKTIYKNWLFMVLKMTVALAIVWPILILCLTALGRVINHDKFVLRDLINLHDLLIDAGIGAIFGLLLGVCEVSLDLTYLYRSKK